MPIDTSIYAGIGDNPIQQPDMVGNLMKTLQLQSVLNQNKLFQQEFAAKQAMGPLLQASIDPDSGEIDYNKATSLMAQDPRTAFLAPDFAKEAIARNKAQADTIAQQLDNTIKMRGLVSSALGPVAELGEKATQNDMLSAAGSLITQLKANGLYNSNVSNMIVDVLSKAPKDGQAVADYASQINQWAMSGKERAEQTLGQLFEQDMGGKRQITQVVNGQPKVIWSETKTAAPEGPTDLTRKMSAIYQSLKADGYSDADARKLSQGIAAGRFEVSRDPVSGNASVIDVATGKPMGAGKINAPEPTPTPPAGQTLWDQADKATGLVSGAKAGIARTMGQIPGVPVAEETLGARQNFRSAGQDMVRALAINPRFPVAEQERIQSMLDLDPSLWDSPAALKARMRGVDTYLATRQKQAEADAANEKLPADQRQAQQQNISTIKNFRAFMGVPPMQRKPLEEIFKK